MNNQKMIHSAKQLDLLAKSISLICMMIGTATIILGVVLLFLKDDFFIDTFRTLNLGYVTVNMTSNVQLDPSVIESRVILSLIIVLIMLLLTVYGIKLFRNILNPMKEGRPFDNIVSINLRKMGWLILIGGIINTVLGNVGMALTMNAFNLQKLFDQSKISNVQLEYKINYAFLIFAVILFLLSYIFRYGEYLQQESDETL